MPVTIENKDVWFVWTKTGRTPRKAHETQEAALLEAERLARKLPGKKFLVLHATHKVSVHASDCATHNEPALPAEPCDCAEAA